MYEDLWDTKCFSIEMCLIGNNKFRGTEVCLLLIGAMIIVANIMMNFNSRQASITNFIHKNCCVNCYFQLYG